MDKPRPVNNFGRRTKLAAVELDEIASDHRLAALRHVSGHIRRVAVTHYNHLIIAGERCRDCCHESTAPVILPLSGRQQFSAKLSATAIALYKLKPPRAP